MHELLFSLLLVFLPTQFGYHWWPDWAMILGRRIDYLSPTLYLSDGIIFLLLISWLISKRKTIFLSRKIQQSAAVKIICFGIFVFANIYFAASRIVAVFAWIKILELFGLGLYIVKTKPKISDIIFPLSIGVFYSSFIAIIQFILQHSIGGIFWFLGERTFSFSTPGIARVDFGSLFKLRSYATFPHPNVLGGFLAITIPLIIPTARDRKKLYYFATIVLGIIALALTFSRSAWVIFVFGISYIVYRKNKKMFMPVVLLITVLSFIIGTTFGFQDESVVVRGQLNAAAISMVRTSPVFGNGMGNFLVRLPDYLVSRTIYFLQPVHNIYLLVFSETGCIGFSIFLLIVWSAFKKKRFTSIHFSLISLLLLGLVDHYPLTLQQGQLLLTVFLSLSLIQ